MHVLSVNVGAAQPLDHAKASGVTGIFKRPAAGPVPITAAGLAGDAICDTENHGGPDQAVYVYGADDYAWWSAELGRELTPGTFGENLTIAGLASTGLAIGDRLSAAEVTLEVTDPRIPCMTLARRMGDPAFLKRFRAAERPGVYCRVVRAGEIRAGEPVSIESYAGERILALELFRDFFAPSRDAATLVRHLAAPISIRSRADKERQLRELLMEQTR
jgi:MOSC domain-containing protein YiiM